MKINKKKLFVLLLVSIFSQTAFATEIILTPATKTSTSTVSTKVTSGSITYQNIFTKNLTVGSFGQDVMALKKIISLEFSTKVDGTASFTSNTASDVTKLQEKYAVDILIPNGLSKGTGFAGPSTIKKLNQLATKYNIKLSDFTITKEMTIKNYFTVNLGLGSSGNDVLLLKMILNSDKDTKLITSPYNVSNVFDKATEIALNKFQEKYAKDILYPSGLTKGTGIAGPATRKKLNLMLTNILNSIKNESASTTNINSDYDNILKTLQNY